MRALVVAAFAAVPATTPAFAQAPWPTQRWATSSLADQGLDPAPLTALHRAVERGAHGYVDRLLVVHDGYLVVDEQYAHDYGRIGRGRRDPLGCGVDACDRPGDAHAFNYYHPDWHPYYRGRRVHTLQSVTKSITATLIGIALGRDEIPDLDAPLLAFLDQDYDVARVDERLLDATLEDLLTMRTGIEWHETDRPLDETNTTWQLEHAGDWVQFTLDQPMDAAPREKWVYNSGGSHLMSAIIRAATGRTVDEYAVEHLFGPLGIRDYYWKITPTGLPDTEGGLYLEAEDVAKIGYLYLRDGQWEGRHVLPPGWVDLATARHVDRVNAAGWGYGFQWWRLDRNGIDVWAGLGFGGQFLLIVPQYRLVGVVHSWNVFGKQHGSILGPFLDALLATAGAAEP